MRPFLRKMKNGNKADGLTFFFFVIWAKGSRLGVQSLNATCFNWNTLYNTRINTHLYYWMSYSTLKVNYSVLTDLSRYLVSI
jgi:hypothetical protein